jgi:hypothetical protein
LGLSARLSPEGLLGEYLGLTSQTLTASLVSNGWLPQLPIWAIPQEDGTLLVKNGNRRLATLLLLKAGRIGKDREIPQSLYENIPYIEVQDSPDTDIALILDHFRDAVSWDLQSRVEAILTLNVESATLHSRVGYLSPSALSRQVGALELYNRARELAPDLGEFRTGVSQWLRLLQSVDDIKDVLSDVEDLVLIASLIFGRHCANPQVESEDDVALLAELLDSRKAMKSLRGGERFHGVADRFC